MEVRAQVGGVEGNRSPLIELSLRLAGICYRNLVVRKLHWHPAYLTDDCCVRMDAANLG